MYMYTHSIYTDKIDFMRDIIAFMVVLVVIVGVSIDGKVSYSLWKHLICYKTAIQYIYIAKYVQARA